MRHRSPPRVLRFVILQILAALDVPPPVLVVAVPLDRRFDRQLEAVLRLPAELAFDLARVDRVAAVLAGAVLELRDDVLPIFFPLSGLGVGGHPAGELL